MTGLAELVNGFADMRLLVLGDAYVDGYLEGETTRYPPTVAAPVVDVRESLDLPGGAAAAAASAAALGSRPVLFSVVGDDPGGTALRRGLDDAGVDARLKVSRARRTLARRRIRVAGRTLVRYDEGGVWPVSASADAWLLDQLPEAWGQADAVLVTDAGHGVMTPAIRAELRRLQLADPRLLVLDANGPMEYADVGVTALRLGVHEAVLLAGAVDGRHRAEALEGHAEALLGAAAAELVAVTLGTDGGFFAEVDRPSHRTYVRGLPGRESSGAEHTFAAALTVALAAGAPTWSAAEVATAAAAVASSKGRTAVCEAPELRLRLLPLEKVTSDVRRLAVELDDRRAHGQRIVFASGRFAQFHRGHVALLERARAAGDMLVVGVDAGDPSGHVQDGRAAAEERSALLAGLSCVDAVVPFSGPAPDALIRTLRPQVMVTGADERESPAATAAGAIGAEVVSVPRVPDVSAPSLLERIRRARPLTPAAEDAA